MKLCSIAVEYTGGSYIVRGHSLEDSHKLGVSAFLVTRTARAQDTLGSPEGAELIARLMQDVLFAIKDEVTGAWDPVQTTPLF